jgi:phospholipase/carboxylesterase
MELHERHREVIPARPGLPTEDALPPGLHALPGTNGADHALVVPSALPDTPVPLVVYLHGSGSDPARSLPLLQDDAERLEFLLLVPKSYHYTWDVIVGGFGPDVSSLDLALEHVFACFPVDPERVVLAGFSDGASYALSLGLINGTLFRRILAYSPGFLIPAPRNGRPEVFVSHGVDDPVLPIERCSRLIVPELRAEGYEVDYREFDGGHAIPPDMVAASLAFLGAPRATMHP